MSYSCTCQLWESVITANLFSQTEDGAKMVADVLILSQPKRYVDDREAGIYGLVSFSKTR